MSTTTVTRPFGAKFTAPLLLGSTLNPINSSMIATALVGIGADMDAGPGATASLISVLYLCSAVMQPTMGKLSTLFGPRRVYLSGVVILLLGGLVGAAAPTLGYLLVSRALIGIGTSAAYPTAMALVRKRADDLGTGVPSRVLGNFSIAGQVTAIVGLPLGGILVGVFGWRALFVVNIPLALATFALTLVGVAKDAPLRLDRKELLTALDLPGIAMFSGATVSLLLFLSDLASPPWWLLALAVVLFSAMLAWERRTLRPLIDVRTLGANTSLLRTYLRQMLLYLGTYTGLYGVTQWMEQSRGLTPFGVGLVMLPMSVLSIVIARLVSARGWVRGPLLLAGVAVALGGALLLVLDSGASIVALLGFSLLLGAGNGLVGFANQAALYMQTSAADIAVASGLLRTSMYIGAIFSSSLIGLAFGSTAGDAGLHDLAWVLGGIGVGFLVLTAADRRIPRTTG